MRLPALAAQLQGFAHSAKLIHVGVSLHHTHAVLTSQGRLITLTGTMSDLLLIISN